MSFYCIGVLLYIIVKVYIFFFYIFQVGFFGKVVGIDYILELVLELVENIKKDSNLVLLLELGQMKFVSGDGRQGFFEDSFYDVIYVGVVVVILFQAVSLY